MMLVTTGSQGRAGNDNRGEEAVHLSVVPVAGREMQAGLGNRAKTAVTLEGVVSDVGDASAEWLATETPEA